jgi:hypothetical protein
MQIKRIEERGKFKAQFWSFDLVFAMIIFMAAITILAITWLNISNQLSVSNGGIATLMQLQAQQIGKNLVSQGNPGNWDSVVNSSLPSTYSNIAAGLASSQGSSSLSSQKLYTLLSMVNNNYSEAGLTFGATYDYYIIINGGPFNITMGRNPITNGAVTTFISTRSAFINGIPVIIKVYLWSSSTSSAS